MRWTPIFSMLCVCLGAATASAKEMTCQVTAEVYVIATEGGDALEVRRDDTTHEIELTLVEDGVLLDGQRCDRSGETRYRCQDLSAVALLGDRVRIMSAQLGGVRGDAGFALLSGTCDETK